MKIKDILKENSVLVSPIRTIRPIGDTGSQIKMSDLVKEEELVCSTLVVLQPKKKTRNDMSKTERRNLMK